MNLKQIKYIVAVDEHKNFTRAAESCEIAQSTLSREIMNLETELDVMIFDRSRTPIVPTKKGLDLLAQARKITKKIEDFTLMAKTKDGSVKSSFTLGIWSGIASTTIPIFIKAFAQHNIKLFIHELSLDQIQEYLSNNKVDACIAPNLRDYSGYYNWTLYKQPFELKKGIQNTAVSIQDLEKEFIDNGAVVQNDLKSIFKKIFTQNGCSDILIKASDKIQYQCGSLETIKKILEHNGGISIFPKNPKCLSQKNSDDRQSYSVEINLLSPRAFEKEEELKLIRKNILENLKTTV
ncbi:LysR family transcriptional regulator [Brumimicrobium aurantiacum]|uniref:LysR family transcriptional regulator n=1 Tax=Brumimicrobium aurantiacum TaxID=1737063 RepID=UPI0014040F1C|nr:LysR family transcriptional regulator [Brumimicrobium aurantiacum]